MNNCNTENTPRGIIMTVVRHEKYIKYFNAIVILERIYCILLVSKEFCFYSFYSSNGPFFYVPNEP